MVCGARVVFVAANGARGTAGAGAVPCSVTNSQNLTPRLIEWDVATCAGTPVHALLKWPAGLQWCVLGADIGPTTPWLI